MTETTRPDTLIFGERQVLKKYRSDHEMHDCIAVAKRLEQFTPGELTFGNGYQVTVLVPSPVETDNAAASMPRADAVSVQFRLHYKEMLDLTKAVSDWFAYILDQSHTTEGTYALHGDLHLRNILLNSETRTIYIIDPSAKAVNSSVNMAWLDFQLFLMSTAISVFPHYDHFWVPGINFLDRVEPNLERSSGLWLRLRSHLQLLRFLISKSIRQGRFAELGQYMMVSGIIALLLVFRSLVTPVPHSSD